MQYYTFQHIFDEFSKQKEGEHDIGKVRDKFTEIIDVVGINSDLLRKYRDEETGKMVGFNNSNRLFCFPETICDFCIEILKRYTDSDFKLLRKGKFKDVPIKTLAFLINGFTNYLKDLGYERNTIILEKEKMKKQMAYNFSTQLFQLRQECQGLLTDAEDYNTSLYENLYEDATYLTWYMVEKVKMLRDYIVSVHGNLTELRFEEVSNFALDTSINTSSAEALMDIQYTSILADVLEHDKNYQNLLKKQLKILCSEDFVKKLKTPYQKNNDQLKAIKEQYEHKLFGDKIKDAYQTDNFALTHPLKMLYKAIEWTDETKPNEVETTENKSYLTDEQRKILKAELEKNCPQLFALPEPEGMEQKIKKKGTIKFPCCIKEEIIVYTSASGYIVNKCPRCSKQILFNLDDMTAELYETPKGHMKPI